MKLLQSNVINQLHQAEGCIPKDALVCLMEVGMTFTHYIAGCLLLELKCCDVRVTVP
jgi:hypothetical protein